jgi:hypothetical protein
VIARLLKVFVPSAAVTCTFFINFCDWIYRCGCRSLWAGAAAHCNVHDPGARHCPFCEHGAAVYIAVLSWILIPQLAVSVWPSRLDWPIRLALALLAFPVAGSIVAVALGWWDGYWAR